MESLQQSSSNTHSFNYSSPDQSARIEEELKDLNTEHLIQSIIPAKKGDFWKKSLFNKYMSVCFGETKLKRTKEADNLNARLERPKTPHDFKLVLHCASNNQVRFEKRNKTISRMQYKYNDETYMLNAQRGYPVWTFATNLMLDKLEATLDQHKRVYVHRIDLHSKTATKKGLTDFKRFLTRELTRKFGYTQWLIKEEISKLKSRHWHLVLFSDAEKMNPYRHAGNAMYHAVKHLWDKYCQGEIYSVKSWCIKGSNDSDKINEVTFACSYVCKKATTATPSKPEQSFSFNKI